MRQYRLADCSYVSVSPRGAVFLNTDKGTYIGIDADQSRALAAAVEGWPDLTGEPPPSEEICRSFAEALCERGLLAHAPCGHRVDAPGLPTPNAELLSWKLMECPSIQCSHVCAFLRALLLALWSLNFCSLSHTVRRCNVRRGSASSDFDIDTARELLAIYTYIRLFIFSRRGRCLLDSLTLIEFMAAYGVHPRFVIGVQVRPFAAHSWVQHADWVFNGTVGFVRNYDSILVI